MTTTDTPTIANALINFVSKNILEQDELVEPEENLLEELGVDSLGMLQIVGFIEKEYQIKISPIHFTLDNFININVLSEFVSGLLRGNNE